MNILVTICARGGSKGVKNKNIRSLLGKPLIAYSIEQALRWGRDADIVISTDSKEIAQVAKEFGAQILFMRPSELADDDTPKIPVIRHALKESERILNKAYLIVVDLDPTAPIRKVSDIENAYQKFMQEKPLTLFSVVKAHKNPYFNMVEVDKGYAKLCKSLPDAVCRRQDAPIVYDMNASIYIYQRGYLLDEENNSPISEESILYVMDDVSGFDIDREVDFKFVEFLIKEGMFTL